MRPRTKARIGAVAYGVIFTLSLAALEPALGHLSYLGDTLSAKQYLVVAPSGQVAYFLPATRSARTDVVGAVALFFLVIGLIPAARNLLQRRIRGWSMLGLALLIGSACLLLVEFLMSGEWMLGGFLAVRYLALGGLGVGAVLAARSRAYFCAVGVTAFCWDISAAIFWAFRSGSVRSSVPVPYFGGYQMVEATGLPCWVVMAIDAIFIIFFLWFYGSKWDPLKIFVRP